MIEHWKDIAGYEGLYQVSNLGRIKALPRKVVLYNGGIACRKEHILKEGTRSKYYKFVILSDGYTTKHWSVHHLVATAFVDNPNNLSEVNHKDENPANNRADNLEWCTRQYNIDYSKSKRIFQLDKNGNVINEFISIADASRKTKILRQSINNALVGWSQTAGGYLWSYAPLSK